MPDEQNPANVPLVYSNNVRLGMSFTDFKLFFGEFVQTGPLTTPAGELIPSAAQLVDRVCIAISPDIVPALVEGLNRGIEAYVAQFGPLRQIPAAIRGGAETRPAATPTMPR